MERLNTLFYESYWDNDTREILPEKRTDWHPGAKALFEVREKGVFVIIIDNIEIDYHYDVAALELSSYGNGIFPIIVCGCGYIGCSGAYVEVSHKDDCIIWEHFWHGQCCGEPKPDDELEYLKINNNFYLKAPLIFKKEDYKAVLKSIIDELEAHKDSFSYRDYQDDLKKYKSGNISRD